MPHPAGRSTTDKHRQQKKGRSYSADVDAIGKNLAEMTSPTHRTTNDNNSDDTSAADASIGGGDNKPRNTTERPSSFNRVTFEEEAKKCMPEPTQQDGKNLPNFLNKLAINDIIIALAEAIGDVYKKYPRRTFPYEVALISVTIDFLQRRVNLKDPKMIKKFALFFRRTVEQFAVRYYNEDGDEFVNASLGELDEDLYNSADPKVIMIMTAFYTRKCLTSKQNDDTINHIVDDNDTMEYQTKAILRGVFQCMNDDVMSLGVVRGIMKERIVRADIHTRGGTNGKGNKFPTYQEEVNGDKALADVCAEFEKVLKLDKPIMFNHKKVKQCQPILIDIIFGVLNMALFSAFLHAQDLTPYIFLASKRCEIIFQPNGGEYKVGPLDSEVAIIAQGMHPNSVQQHLSKNMPEEIVQLDAGITAVLETLKNVPIRVISVDGVESNACFVWGPSDYFQRLYLLRMSGDIKVEDIDYERLKEAKDELKAMRDELEAEKEELEAAKTKLDEAKERAEEGERKARALEKEVKRQKRAQKRVRSEQDAEDAEDELLNMQG